MKNYVLYFNSPNEVTVMEEPIPTPKSDELLIQNVFSGISAGTELMLYRGLMPDNMDLDSNIASLRKKLTYPFKYGYCSVGRIVETGSERLNDLLNQWVFAFNPHESYFCVKKKDILLLPPNITPHDALFLPNLETALNFILDSSPLIGENVLILGLGIVGLLTTALLEQFPLSLIIGVDGYEKRRNLGRTLGVHTTFDPNQPDFPEQLTDFLGSLAHPHLDLVYELTGNPAALNSAIELIGYEGRIVIGSWYGKKSCPIDLGGRFHRNRIKLTASQVSTIASELQGRWDKKRRLSVVLKMLNKIQPSRFVSHQFHITQAHKAYQLLNTHPEEALLVSLTY